MALKQNILYHQVHPAKLATDAASAFVSLYLSWEHELVLALLIHIVPPIAASAALLAFRNDFEDIKRSPPGGYRIHGFCRALPIAYPMAMASNLFQPARMVFGPGSL